MDGTDRQVSTSSMTALTDQEGTKSGHRIITTVIPIREEFRCRRAWFFYHDLRALVTSVSACMSVHVIYKCHIWLQST